MWLSLPQKLRVVWFRAHIHLRARGDQIHACNLYYMESTHQKSSLCADLLKEVEQCEGCGFATEPLARGGSHWEDMNQRNRRDGVNVPPGSTEPFATSVFLLHSRHQC